MIHCSRNRDSLWSLVKEIFNIQGRTISSARRNCPYGVRMTYESYFCIDMNIDGTETVLPLDHCEPAVLARRDGSETLCMLLAPQREVKP